MCNVLYNGKYVSYAPEVLVFDLPEGWVLPVIRILLGQRSFCKKCFVHVNMYGGVLFGCFHMFEIELAKSTIYS